jgi:hypothetical protein
VDVLVEEKVVNDQIGETALVVVASRGEILVTGTTF